MIVSIPYEHGQICQDFESAKYFKFYLVEEDKTVSFSRVVPNQAQGHAALSVWLKECQVDVIICGRIGDSYLRAMGLAQMDIYGGVEGECDEALLAFINGTLKFNKDITQNGPNYSGASQMFAVFKSLK